MNRFLILATAAIVVTVGYTPAKLRYEDWKRKRQLKDLEEDYLDQLASQIPPEQEAAFNAGAEFIGGFLGTLESLDA